MVRKRKKKVKLRGMRTHGGGSVKKRRGSGSKGGKGLAGSGKEKKTKWDFVRINFPDHIGKQGFKRPKKVQEEKSFVNVGYIDENIEKLIESGVAKKEKGLIVVDASKLGAQKVLGSGKVTKKFKIVAKEFSSNAKKKIEGMEGEACGS